MLFIFLCRNKKVYNFGIYPMDMSICFPIGFVTNSSLAHTVWHFGGWIGVILRAVINCFSMCTGTLCHDSKLLSLSHWVFSSLSISIMSYCGMTTWWVELNAAMMIDICFWTASITHNNLQQLLPLIIKVHKNYHPLNTGEHCTRLYWFYQQLSDHFISIIQQIWLTQAQLLLLRNQLIACGMGYADLLDLFHHVDFCETVFIAV